MCVICEITKEELKAYRARLIALGCTLPEPKPFTCTHCGAEVER